MKKLYNLTGKYAMSVLCALLLAAVLASAVGCANPADEQDYRAIEQGIPLSNLSADEPISESKTPLSFVPTIITAEDFARIDARIAQNLDDENKLNRFRAFYCCWSLSILDTRDEDARAKVEDALLQQYPIVTVTDVYTLDETATELEKAFILDILASYAELSQEDAIQLYENLYEMVEASEVENKDEIMAYLPEPPILTAGE